jgi:hypothetical protein
MKDEGRRMEEGAKTSAIRYPPSAIRDSKKEFL